MHESQIQTLVRLSTGGDRGAFGEIVREYQQMAYSVANRLLWDPRDAEDAVQEAFVRIWRNLHSFHPGSKFSTWMYTVVTNVCVDLLRTRKRRSPEVSENVMRSAAQDGEDPADIVARQDLLRILQSLAESLPSRQRLIFTLRDLQDLPIREVVLITGLSKASVKTNLHLARRRLREVLSSVYDITGTQE
jgi:RNA polymerase sigma-70 factor (ECF subfamily)